jgi:hypothetical protein
MFRKSFFGQGPNLVVLAALSLGITGCGTSALPPPVTVLYRSSLWGYGEVVIIKNDSSHHLYNVRVIGRDLKKAQSASVQVTDHMAPGAVREVGWLEFGKWVPMPGETIEVYADGYVIPHISIVPDPAMRK